MPRGFISKVLLTFNNDYLIKNLGKVFKDFSSILGVILLMLEVISYYVEIHYSFKTLITGMLGILIIALIKNMQELKFKYCISDTDTEIEIIIGNIFDQKGNFAIVTNTTFDTTFDKGFMSKESVQGQFVTKYHNSREEVLAKQFQEELKNVEIEEHLSRSIGNSKRYKKGTIIKTEEEDFFVYWIALSDVNETGKPNTVYEDLITSLGSLWDFMAKNGQADTVVMPIIGSGKSVLSMNRENILFEIIDSFITYSKNNKITEKLIICIHPNDLNNKKIDMQKIKEYLYYKCTYKDRNAGMDARSNKVEFK